MDEEQLFSFDTFGFFVCPAVLNAEQIAQLRHDAERFSPRFFARHGHNTILPLSYREVRHSYDPKRRLELGEQEEEQEDDEAELGADDRRALEREGGGFWSQAQLDLLDHPRLSPILEQLFAGEHHRAVPPSPRNPAFRLDHLNVHTHDAFPPSHLRGGNLHGGNNDLLREGSPDANPCRYFHKGADGRYSNGLVTVAYELYDTHCNGGGFGCLAGSHKTGAALPEGWRDMEDGVHPMITRVPASAGDAIVFTEALMHTTLPWTAPSTRATIFLKYTRRGEAFCEPEHFCQPSDAAGWVGAESERVRAILEPATGVFGTGSTPTPPRL